VTPVSPHFKISKALWEGRRLRKREQTTENGLFTVQRHVVEGKEGPSTTLFAVEETLLFLNDEEAITDFA